ncbi:MAG: hypothetical protein E6G51_02415 [Actinobacteria bacterium]|nr:MAG: hypothetical protein E6G51_02415 [Actinomycetota bacterium]
MRRARRGTIGICCSLLAALLLLVSGSAQAYRYVPDAGFGSGGAVNLLAVNGRGGDLFQVREVRPGPGGTVWVHYRALLRDEDYECETQSYLARYLANGAPDASFGVGGVVPVYSPVGCHYPRLQVDSRHRPLITWDSAGGSRGPSTFGMVRYKMDGSLDPSFDGDGVVLLSIPCPGGNGAGIGSDAAGNLLLSVSCWADESAAGLPTSPLQAFFLHVFADGRLDTDFGDGGLVTFPLEEGWDLPGVAAVETDGSAILWQETRLGVEPRQLPRLLRLRPDGTLASSYQARTEASLRRLASLAAPLVPDEITDFALRSSGNLVLSGRFDHRGWVASLRHDGSLERKFSGDGFRRFSKEVLHIALDRQDRLFVLGREFGRWWIDRLLADGNRDRSVGGPRGQRLQVPSEGALSDLVSLWHGMPLLFFRNLGSCTSPQDCAEPAELRRLRLAVKKPQR